MKKIKAWKKGLAQALQYIHNHPQDSIIKGIAALAAVAASLLLVWLLIKLLTQVALAIIGLLDLLVPVAVLGLVAYVFLADWLEKRRRRRDDRKREEEIRRETEKKTRIWEKNQNQERIYQKMSKVIFAVARDLGPVGIVPPERLSKIYSPTRIVPKMGGEVLLGLFLLQKSHDNIDTDLLTSTMQTKVNQELTAGEFPNIIDGEYDGFAIDKVKDSDGFVEVYAALTDDSYRRYKLDGELDKDTPPIPVDRRSIKY